MALPVVETKEIGIPIGLNKGTYTNTEYIAGNIQLKKIGATEALEPIYEAEGSWESAVVDLVDRFREFDKFVLSKTLATSDVYAILTRTSDNGTSFNEYVATTPEGKIQSETKRFIQIKIKFFAGMFDEDLLISDFTLPEDVDMWASNEFIETSGVLKLKRDYEFDMTKDATWLDKGSLHRKVVNKVSWKKIDSIGVE